MRESLKISLQPCLKTPKMFVIASNSVFAYKGKPVSVKQVAEDLGVRYLVEVELTEGECARAHAKGHQESQCILERFAGVRAHEEDEQRFKCLRQEAGPRSHRS